MRSHWELEYRAWRDSETEKALEDRLALMGQAHGFGGDFDRIRVHRRILPRDMGPRPDRQRGSETGFSLYPKFAIPGAGENGGSGEADLAIGYFSKTAPGQTPQVLCEFKGRPSPAIIVRKGEEGRYVLVARERRHRAVEFRRQVLLSSRKPEREPTDQAYQDRLR